MKRKTFKGLYNKQWSFWLLWPPCSPLGATNISSLCTLQECSLCVHIYDTSMHIHISTWTYTCTHSGVNMVCTLFSSTLVSLLLPRFPYHVTQICLIFPSKDTTALVSRHTSVTQVLPSSSNGDHLPCLRFQKSLMINALAVLQRCVDQVGGNDVSQQCAPHPSVSAILNTRRPITGAKVVLRAHSHI